MVDRIQRWDIETAFLLALCSFSSSAKIEKSDMECVGPVCVRYVWPRNK